MTAVEQVFHVALAALVERVVDRIGAAVELERQEAEAVAEFDVEGRRGLQPAAVEEDIGVAVPGEHVRLHGPAHALGRQMVAHVGKAETRRNADGAARGGEQRRLRDAPAVAGGEHAARAHAGGREGDAVRVVAKAVAHGVVELDRTLARRRAAAVLVREGLHGGMVRIDEGRGGEACRRRRGLHPATVADDDTVSRGAATIAPPR